MRSLLTPRRPITWALLALNALLIGAVSAALWRGTETPTLLATPPQTPRLTDYPLARPASPVRLAGLQDRSLLYATRRLYVAPPPDATPPKPDFHLVGTFVIPEKPAVALLAGPSGAALKVKRGDTLDGWRVEVVEARRVVLTHGADSLEISSTAGGRGGLLVHSTPLTPPAPPTGSSARPGVRVLGAGGTVHLATASPAASPPTSGQLTPRLYQPPPK